MLFTTVSPTTSQAAIFGIYNNKDEENHYDIRYKEDELNEEITLNVKDILLQYLASHPSVTSVGKSVLTFTMNGTDNPDEDKFVVTLDAGKYRFKVSNFPIDAEYNVTMETEYIWKNGATKTVGTAKFDLRVSELDNVDYDKAPDFTAVKWEQVDAQSINDEYAYTYDESVADSIPAVSDKEADEIISDIYNEEHPDESTGNNDTVADNNGKYEGTEEEINNKDKEDDIKATVAKPTISKAILSNKVLSVKFTTKDKTRTGIQYRIYYKNGTKLYKVADKKTKKLSLKVKNIKKNNVYFVQARTYTVNGGKTTYSKWSNKKYFIQQANVTKKAKNTIKWQKINGAKSYVVYGSAKKNGKYTKIKTIKAGKNTYYKVTNKNCKYVKVVVKGTNKTTSTSKIYKLK